MICGGVRWLALRVCVDSFEVIRLTVSYASLFSQEYVPPALVRAAFIMLYKNKGSVDNPAMYRCIGLLPHAYSQDSVISYAGEDHEWVLWLSFWLAGGL